MANDVILETTVKFIMGNEKNLGLAFRVEEALPLVQEKLARKILDGIKKKFSGKSWEIIPDDGFGVGVRKRGWSNNNNLSGIWLESNDGKNFKNFCVGLWLSEDVQKRIEQAGLKGELDKLKTDDNPYSPLKWKPMSGDLGDWSTEEFLKKALSDPEKIVDELTAQLEKWLNCPDVQKVLSVVERSLQAGP